MAHNNIGLIYSERGSYGQAEKELKKELSLYPNYDKALFNLGHLYYKQKRLTEAAQLWQVALKVNPNYYEAYSSLLNLSNQLR
jgi:tetratricopeptide (TPR) repeat protein